MLNGWTPAEAGHFIHGSVKDDITPVGLHVLWANLLLWVLTHPQSNMVVYVFIMVAEDRTVVRVRRVRTRKFRGLEVKGT